MRLDRLLPPTVKTFFGLGQLPALARLTRTHVIYKENNILFPLAERVIPESDQPRLRERFEHLEHEETGEGIHEKYLALADHLCRTVSLP
ncbi:hypothetical protein ATHL_01294 [Anaerolinea thermolimosa]|nr:hypothetical protein [Anaerolinea thermolimosa]GAP06440.1 hypothetical protein ATHL_01294 [Anaerolinea thermolimosa]